MEIKYLTIKEASNFLKISAATLRNWDKKRILCPYRHPVNNYRLYRLDQLENFRRKIENAKNRQGGKKLDIQML